MPNILRSRRLQLLIGAVIVLGVFFYAGLWAIDRYFPQSAPPAVVNLPPLPPLEPVKRSSYVIAPVAISINAIRQSLEGAAPRQLVDKNNNPINAILSSSDVGIDIARGPIQLVGRPDDLAVGATLNGSVKISGEIMTQAGNLIGSIAGAITGDKSGSGKNSDNPLGGLISGLLGGSDKDDDEPSNRGNTGNNSNTSNKKAAGNTPTKVQDQKADIHGQVVMHSRPVLTENWRLQPNLKAQLDLGDSSMKIAGLDLNMTQEAKPMIDNMVNEQVAELEKWLRNAPIIENVAREQWAKMCRTIPLGGGNTGMPKLWLGVKPVRAAAAQPRIDAQNVTLTVGVLAETRISSTNTKPKCPFPAKLELVAPMDDGRIKVDMPIDVPFTEINKVLEAQIKGHHYPEDNSAPVDVEVRGVNIGAAGERILIALDVRAHEKKSWFGFGASATVQVWGRPTLDAQNQILRMTDLTVAVDSDAGFGLVGRAARAAQPYLKKALEEHAVIDLKPFAADALKQIGVALADFERDNKDVRISAKVNGMRLTGIAFDSHTLRVIGEADGNARIAILRLPPM
jgi:hypothetical protein